MRCFYHQDKEAVATCKSCGKALCAECAVDLGKGVACRGRCEDDARNIIELVERNIQSSRPSARMSLVQPKQVETPDKETQVSATLTRHIQSSQKWQKWVAVFSIVIGVVFAAAAVANRENLLLFAILGVCFLAFGVAGFLSIRKCRTEALTQKQNTQTASR